MSSKIIDGGKSLKIGKPQNSISTRCACGEHARRSELFDLLLSYMRKENVWLVSDSAVMAAVVEIDH